MAAQMVDAGNGLLVTVEADEIRVEFGEPDWFGPGRLTGTRDEVIGSTRAEAAWGAIILRLEARRDLHDIATGEFARPSFAWPSFDPGARRADGVAPGTRGFGFQYMEFALPTHTDASLARWRLFPPRPSVVEPLGLVAPDGRCLLLGPIDCFHDQIISVIDGVSCGWHGDLERVPQGFATEVAIIAGASARECIDRYGAMVRERHGTERPPIDADELGRRVSYWTDNGAAYWYRREPGMDTPTTLTSTLDDLRARGIAFGAVQLDSWWYPHEVLRPFDTDEWVVPPTGLIRWEPRDDVLPEGVNTLRKALGDPPLVTHCRHLSSASPYVGEYECWVDGDRAHPVTSDLYERWLDDAKSWGVDTFEHDWLVESFLGVHALRAEPGRARRWQEHIDAAATDRGMTLQWCMATPADMLQTATLRSLTSVRTSGDHGYLLGPGELWAWFLITNALARALDLRPFKDVFRSDPRAPEHHAEVEALLSALSTGPVGIGDELGRADVDIIRRTCRDDGVIVRPDVALAAVSESIAQHPVARAVPLIADAWTDHAAGRWVYLTAINVVRTEERLDATRTWPIDRPMACWNWRRRSVSRVDPGDTWVIALDHLDWDYRVLAPIAPCGIAVIGDPSRYATAGVARVAGVEALADGLRCTVLGAGELVSLVGWAEAPPRAVRVADAADLDVTHSGNMWRVEVPVSDVGSATVDVLA